MGECAYAAVSDQLLSGRGRPGRLRGVGASVGGDTTGVACAVDL